MNMKTTLRQTDQQRRFYQDQEFNCPLPPKSSSRLTIGQRVAAVFSQIQQWRPAVSLFQAEPEIREYVDEMGRMLWQVYDPTHDRQFDFDSQFELLSWLEERHRCPSRPAAFFV
jgi:type II secretory pathway predicted ATPase ExeA